MQTKKPPWPHAKLIPCLHVQLIVSSSSSISPKEQTPKGKYLREKCETLPCLFANPRVFLQAQLRHGSVASDWPASDPPRRAVFALAGPSTLGNPALYLSHTQCFDRNGNTCFLFQETLLKITQFLES